MLQKETLQSLRNDPRRTLKVLRLTSPAKTYCDRCCEYVSPDSRTTELSKRIDNDTMLFFRRCPNCNKKIHFQEYHI